MASSLSSITTSKAAGPISAASAAPEWEIALTSWVERAPTRERPAREEVQRRIQACYAKKKNHRRELNLSGFGLTSIDGLIFPSELQMLYLNNNKITSVDRANFQGIQRLDLSNNEITSVHGDIFQGIEWLYLAENQITSIAGAIFQGIEQLDLGRNHITSIAEANFQGVNELILDHNHIASIAGANFQGVRKLNLEYNHITTIVGVDFQEIQELFLNDNRITSIDAGVDFREIKVLNLSFNQITSLASAHFQGVKWLYLSHNQIRSVSEANFQGVKILDLSSNEITSIPGSIFQGLKELILDHNFITSIAGINFQGVEKLNFSYNEITSIANAHFQGVRVLYLNNNQIDSIDGVSFQGGTRLYLNNNHIASINDSNFQGIKWLNLSHNQITSISGAYFQGVERLYLNYNPLTHLPLSLANLSETARIFTENCHITLRAAIAFQDALDARRFLNQPCPTWHNTNFEEYLFDTSSLEVTIAHYLQIARQMCLDIDLTFFTESLAADLNSLFSEDERELLNEFLHKLTKTADYDNPRMQGGIVFTVYRVLTAARLSEKFKTNFFALIHEALASCGDRVAITLNRIELQRQLDTTEMSIDLIIGYRRLQLVHEAAEKIVNLKKLRDAIEPMLYMQNKLKAILALPITTEGMLYPGMARVSDDELEGIAEEILKATSLERQLAILSEPLLPIEMKPEQLVNLGTLSSNNPFNFNIQKLWESYLRQKNPAAYEKLSEELENATPAEWSQAIKNLNIELTRRILEERDGALGATSASAS